MNYVIRMNLEFLSLWKRGEGLKKPGGGGGTLAYFSKMSLLESSGPIETIQDLLDLYLLIKYRS